MEKKRIVIGYEQCKPEELTADELRLVESAKMATKSSYAPYSHFSVGAAALLDNGETVIGSNQENAAYPSGMCAERAALFACGSQFADRAVKALAIAAHDGKNFTDRPITPCGACRQVMLEAEAWGKHEMTILLFGKQFVWRVVGVTKLLPFTFSSDFIVGENE
ncbi:MAG: cytidine deaminase [Bacteroidales bacterium]|nr:cytidine deaminase [Bacteroidales bacterium]